MGRSMMRVEGRRGGGYDYGLWVRELDLYIFFYRRGRRESKGTMD